MLRQNSDTSELMEAFQAVWDKIFRSSRAKKEVCKQCERENKKTSKTTGWSDRQRVNWARANYHLHHGKTDNKERSAIPIINTNDKMTIWSSVEATMRVRMNVSTSLWDAQANPSVHVTHTPRTSRDSSKRTKWDTPTKVIFDSSTDSSFESTTSKISAHDTSPTSTSAYTTPATMSTIHTASALTTTSTSTSAHTTPPATTSIPATKTLTTSPTTTSAYTTPATT